MKHGWQETTLNDICDFKRGLTYSKKDEVVKSSKIVLRANNIDLKTHSLNFNELKYLKEKFIIPNDKKIKKDTLMICTASGSKSHLGKIAFIDKEYDCAFGGFMGLIIPRSNILTKFLFYKMMSESYRQFIDNITDGANINNLKYSDLQKFSLLVPHLTEQKRIVKILDKAFEDIEKIKENAKQNLQNSKDLFDSYLNKTFIENTKNWQEIEFEKSIEKIEHTNKIPRKNFLKEGKYPIISQEESLINGYWNDQKDLFKSISPIIIFGDHTKILKYIDFDFVLGADGVKILKPINQIVPKYFYYFLLNIKLRTLGYARHYRLLREQNISYPIDISEQKRIVKILDMLQEKTKKLEEIYNKKLQLTEELKQSILHKAFNGEL